MSEVGVLSLLKDPSGKAIGGVARRWGAAMVKALGIELRVEGGDDVDWEQPVVVMCNHNSHLDIPILYASLPRAFGYLAKRELFDFPVFGRAMTGVGCVPIDRDDRASAHAAISLAAVRVRAGHGIVVFPEGTRGDGRTVRAFKKGPFYLAHAARVPIVPVGIEGSAAICPRNQFKIFPGEVTVRIGSPIPTSGLDGASQRNRIADSARLAIASLARLPVE